MTKSKRYTLYKNRSNKKKNKKTLRNKTLRKKLVKRKHNIKSKRRGGAFVVA